ncbi:hypothetical protein ElyMa_004815500 [Elysia marginata]|uniref:Uncharacterized protein n=1 Tax=Elysia marginata TaxID=1093978 RepID=A0AAV4IES4_9GAST|nr:hypothetical protein ElyMa_004815500 [Elysia marginata]
MKQISSNRQRKNMVQVTRLFLQLLPGGELMQTALSTVVDYNDDENDHDDEDNGDDDDDDEDDDNVLRSSSNDGRDGQGVRRGREDTAVAAAFENILITKSRGK